MICHRKISELPELVLGNGVVVETQAGVSAESLRYKQKRLAEYPSYGNQLDSLWHDIDQGKLGKTAKTSEFYKNNKTVKDTIPKPV